MFSAEQTGVFITHDVIFITIALNWVWRRIAFEFSSPSHGSINHHLSFCHDIACVFRNVRELQSGILSSVKILSIFVKEC
jgi:hypothetical protein